MNLNETIRKRREERAKQTPGEAQGNGNKAVASPAATSASKASAGVLA